MSIVTKQLQTANQTEKRLRKTEVQLKTDSASSAFHTLLLQAFQAPPSTPTVVTRAIRTYVFATRGKCKVCSWDASITKDDSPPGHEAAYLRSQRNPIRQSYCLSMMFYTKGIERITLIMVKFILHYYHAQIIQKAVLLHTCPSPIRYGFVTKFVYPRSISFITLALVGYEALLLRVHFTSHGLSCMVMIHQRPLDDRTYLAGRTLSNSYDTSTCSLHCPWAGIDTVSEEYLLVMIRGTDQNFCRGL